MYIPCCETTVIKRVVLQNQASVEPFCCFHAVVISTPAFCGITNRFYSASGQLNGGASPKVLRGSFSIRHLDAFPMVCNVQVTAISRSIGGSRVTWPPRCSVKTNHMCYTHPSSDTQSDQNFFCKF